MDIRDELTLGIDLGIGSCGWAIIKGSETGGEILGWGARTFDVPETDKKRTPTNQLRREHRGLRKVLRRRRQRMSGLRRLFKEAGLLDRDHKSALKVSGLDPWRLRAEGLDRKLTGEELAVALGHIAKHRGFKSNSKRKSNESSNDSKMLKAIRDTGDKLADYRTVGEMFAKDETFAVRKRNRDGDYSRSVLRDDQQREVKLLLSQQRRMGNSLASDKLEGDLIDIAFFQRPLADSEDKVGWCPFEDNQRRAAKRSPSFERFRFLSRLTALRLQTSNRDWALTAEQIAVASVDFGSQNGMTFKRLRKVLDLDDGIRFDGIPVQDEGKRDVVNRGAGNGCMQGTKALRDALGEAGWNTFRDMPEKLDRIAFVLTFREDPRSIRKGLEEIGLAPLILEALTAGVQRGDFSEFNGAGNISSKACLAVIGHLARGLVYSAACEAAGYDHTKRPETKLDQIANPVARKALTEAIKQVRAIAEEYGLPGHIHVELARDVGKSKEERDEIRSGIEKRNKAKDRLVEEFREAVGTAPRGEDLLRFELWKEQKTRCLYCDQPIHPNAVVSSDNAIQIDHILPWSRSGDDSFVNKTLCHAGCNQEKKGRTPFEWFGKDETRWATFAACVDSVKEMKGRKKRNYLLKDAKILEEKFRPRNLGDTRYATRLLLDAFARWYPADGKVHVFARPGPLTDRLRRGWGIQDLKKIMEPDGEKRKADDRHHALDALIVAATSQSALAKLTKAFQEEEKVGGHRDFSALPPPWPGFVEEVREKFARIFVSRAERRRARGEAHAATIRQIVNDDDGTSIFERKKVEALTEKDLERIKDPERNATLIENIRAWIAAGKQKNTWPKSPKGDDIKKISLRTNKKADVLIRDGAADRGEMVRVDVFRKKNKKEAWEFFLVPIYPHQVADMESWPSPPNRAVAAFKEEDEWFDMTNGYEFVWSLHPLSFVELEKSDGTFIDGYFRGMHRATGNLSLSVHHSKNELVEGIGPRRLSLLRKISVDRLGRRFPIQRETRTWHGAVCT
jgi:CRISPR-associated endonuclease Csn1